MWWFTDVRNLGWQVESSLLLVAARKAGALFLVLRGFLFFFPWILFPFWIYFPLLVTFFFAIPTFSLFFFFSPNLWLRHVSIFYCHWYLNNFLIFRISFLLQITFKNPTIPCYFPFCFHCFIYDKQHLIQRSFMTNFNFCMKKIPTFFQGWGRIFAKGNICSL